MAENAENTKNKTVAKSEKTKHNKPVLVIIGLIILLFIFLYLFKGLFVAASVNGEKISRFAVISALEKQAGKQTLENMITKTLILQEAKKRNINIGNQEIDAEISKISKNIEAQGSTLDQALALQGMTRNQLKEEIKLQLLVQKMVSQNTNISDEEIDKFIEENKAQFPENTSEADLRKQAKAQLIQQRQSEDTQKLISNLQKNAKTVYFIKY
jgi:foldase protein PrsA